jgi:phage N-6-adenine-methyltransferase
VKTPRAIFSSRRADWETPADLFALLDREFHFTLDACATADNAKCSRYFTPEQDGLAQPWTGRVWLNPPYGRGIERWVRKAYESAQTTAEVVVCLLPVRTDSRWWWQWVTKADERRFLHRRLRFGQGPNRAPFPSAVVVFRNPEHALWWVA